MGTEEPTSPRVGQLRFMLRAFEYPNYRLFFGGQLVSLVGTWISLVASQWLVLGLAQEQHPGEEPLWLGLVGFAGQIPIFLITPLAGVWLDRLNRHRVLMLTQFLSMLQSFALGTLAYLDVVTIPQVIALNAFQGVVNAFDIPARQSFVVDLIENRKDLGNAIALNSSMVHLSRLLGPLVGGVLIAFFNEAACFFIDGASYFAVLLALSLMRVTMPKREGAHPRVLAALGEGFRYSFGFAPVRTLLLMTAVTSLTTMSQSVLLPVFAKEIYRGGATEYGFLLGAAGFGAFVGSMYLASRSSVIGLGRVIWIACASLGIAFLSLSIAPSLWIALPILVVSGGAMVTQMASCNTLLQTIVDDDKRGRVMSLFTMAFMGMAPFGSLLAGRLATYWGAPRTIALSGAVCMAASIAFALYLPRLRPLVRTIYVRRGILPEVAEGLQASSTPPLPSTE